MKKICQTGGGQPGHGGHSRKPSDPAVDSFSILEYNIKEGSLRDDCGSPLERDPGKDCLHDMFVLPVEPVRKQRHNFFYLQKKKSGKNHYADPPSNVTDRCLLDVWLTA
ncbi:MAG: hypothetical protein LBF40_10485 [Deltaproteobacteria bacterium]|nr:hypothetical protein [Deltaproteobacteria bacterium]